MRLANAEGDKNKTVLLGRADLDQEFRLEQFEEAVEKALSQKGSQNNKHKNDLAQLLANGHIPKSIRDEFSLPKDMRNRDVDFIEVRTMDAQSSIRHPEWSGQDVLATSINQD